MLCEIDLEKAQGYPGRYLEPFSTTNRAPAYAECRESIAKPGLEIVPEQNAGSGLFAAEYRVHRIILRTSKREFACICNKIKERYHE